MVHLEFIETNSQINNLVLEILENAVLEYADVDPIPPNLAVELSPNYATVSWNGGFYPIDDELNKKTPKVLLLLDSTVVYNSDAQNDNELQLSPLRNPSAFDMACYGSFTLNVNPNEEYLFCIRICTPEGTCVESSISFKTPLDPNKIPLPSSPVNFERTFFSSEEIITSDCEMEEIFIQ